MRISEILSEGNIEHIEGEIPPGRGDKEILGSGSQAQVYRSDKGNRVIKSLMIDDATDGTYRFIDMVMDNQDNRYFPKIYSAKMYSWAFPVKRSKLLIEMEKLIPFQNVKTDHLLTMMILKDFGINNQEVGGFDEGSLADMFWSKKGRAALVNQIKNPDLKEAIRLTGEILDTPTATGFDTKQNLPDLHDENIMIRLTANVPQLVIVDPILTT